MWEQWDENHKMIPAAYLGPDTHYTVYAGELYGINMGLELALDHITTYPLLKHIRIFTDNQAAITSTAMPGRQSGQFILKAIAQKYEELRDKLPLVKITLH